MVKIIENRKAWVAEYEENWLEDVTQTGTPDWKLYKRVRNKDVPAAPAVKLNKSRLMLVSTAGGYLAGEQEPYDIDDVLGDYTLRPFPLSTPFEKIAFAHGHYDESLINADPQVGLPLRHLEELVQKGFIDELAPTVVSYMGYQPDATRVVDEVFPQVLQMAKDQQVDAVLFIPM